MSTKEQRAKWSREWYHRNKEKSKQRNLLWRVNNKEYIREKQKQFKRERKLFCIEYLGGKCKDCEGQFNPAVYELHHRDPKEKDRDPSKMFQLSQERLVSEIDKCDLLCANCHRLRHNKELG